MKKTIIILIGVLVIITAVTWIIFQFPEEVTTIPEEGVITEGEEIVVEDLGEKIIIEQLNAEIKVGGSFNFYIEPEYESFNLEEKTFKGIIVYFEIRDDGGAVYRSIKDIIVNIDASNAQITTFVAGTEIIYEDNLNFAELRAMSDGITGSSIMTVIGEVFSIENNEVTVVVERIQRDIQ
jgi:hypothetical protein